VVITVDREAGDSVAELTGKKRKNLKKKSFAFPNGTGPDKGTDQYPIHDEAHAKNALARGRQNLSPDEYKKLVGKVCKKYPGLPTCQKVRNESMNSLIRERFGRNTSKSK
jgi:hypothetical protein